MEKTINIGGKETRLVANGATPRIYRALFKKDVFSDMQHAVTEDGGINSVEVFENLAFVMAKQGGLEGYSVDEWLASFDGPTAIVETVPEIMALWLDTTATEVESKKK